MERPDLTYFEIAILSMCIAITIYFIYQIVRVRIVSAIRIKWILSYDDTHEKFSFDYMALPNKSNYYGFRFPKEGHYKKDLLNELKEEK